MVCKNCGCQVNGDDAFCPSCGAKIEVYENQTNTGVFCPNCGTQMSAADKFCPNCGSAPDALDGNTQGGGNPYGGYYKPPKRTNSGLIIAIIIVAALALLAVGIWFVPSIIDKLSNSDDEIISEEIVENYDDEEYTQDYEEEYVPPVITSLTASSTRGSDYDSVAKQYCYYYPAYICDGDMSTAWSANRNTDPNPVFTFSASERQRVSGLRMTNGYCKSEKTYTRNRRITKVRITYEGGEMVQNFSIDNYRNLIDIPFPSTVDTSYVSIQVIDTYYGDWKDIAISEVEIY